MSKPDASEWASAAEEHTPPGDDPPALPGLSAGKQAALLSLRAAFRSMASTTKPGGFTGESPVGQGRTLEQLLGGEHDGTGKPVRSQAGLHAGDDQAAASIEDEDEKALLEQLQSLTSAEASVSVAAAAAAAPAAAATTDPEASAPASAGAIAPDLPLPVVIEEQEHALEGQPDTLPSASSASQRYAVAGEDAAGLPELPASSESVQHPIAHLSTVGTSASSRRASSD